MAPDRPIIRRGRLGLATRGKLLAPLIRRSTGAGFSLLCLDNLAFRLVLLLPPPILLVRLGILVQSLFQRLHVQRGIRVFP